MHSPQKLPGLVQWFRIGDVAAVKMTVSLLNELCIREFRLLFSWADWETPDGPEWLSYVVDLITTETSAALIPDLFYTPLSKARLNDRGEAKTSHPPRHLGDYALFVKEMIQRYGAHFEWVQIWNEPEWKPYWDWDIDPDAKLFAEMAISAADVIHAHGKKAALGGLSSYEAQWIHLIHTHGLLSKLDAVGFHYSPSWSDQRHRWFGWETEVETVKSHLRGLGSAAEVWVAETGYATIGSTPAELAESEAAQIEFFEKARRAPADKIFWYSAVDQAPDHLTDNVINMAGVAEQAAYHFGIYTDQGMPKALYEHWKALRKALGHGDV